MAETSDVRFVVPYFLISQSSVAIEYALSDLKLTMPYIIYFECASGSAFNISIGVALKCGFHVAKEGGKREVS